MARLKNRDFGKSMSFAVNSNDLLNVGAVDFIGTGNITVTGWINPFDVGEASAGRILKNGKYELFQQSSGRLALQSNGSTTVTSAIDGIVYKKWQFFSVTRTSAGIANFYINGVISGTANQSSGTPAAATTNIIIGNNEVGSRCSNAKIDSLRIFNRILTVAEIQEIYYFGIVPTDSNTSQVAHYNFNDNVQDQTGNGYDGTITGATYSADVPMRGRVLVQPFSNYIDFNGTTDKVTVTNDFIGIGDVTISVWGYVRSLGGASAGRFIQGPKIIFNVTSNNRIAFTSDGSTTFTSPNNTFLLNKWNHFTVTRTSTGATSFYINGQSIGNLGTTSGTPTTAAGNTALGNFLSQTRGFDGKMQDFRFHNRILTQAEIDNLYYKGLSPAGTIFAKYSFDSTVADISGNGNDGTATGTIYNTDVRSPARGTSSNRILSRDFGTCLYFGAVTSDRIVIENSANEVWAGNTDLTVSQWINASAFGDFYSFAIPDSAGSNRTYILVNSSGSLLTNVASTGSTTTGLLLNKWYHVVLIKDRTNSKYQVWLNGTQVVTPTSYTPGTAAGIDICIGQQSAAGTKAWNGKIDQTRMWNRVLTATEISRLYLQGIAVRDSSLIGEWLLDEASGSTALDSSGRGNNGVITGATYRTDVFKKVRTTT